MAMDPEEGHRAGWLLIPVGLNFAGAMGSTSRAAMLLSLALLVVGGIAALLAAWRRIEIGTRVRVIAGIVLTTAALLGAWFTVPTTMRSELNSVHAQTLYDDTIGARLLQCRSAWEMSRDYPAFGVGGWGFRQFVRFYVTPAELQKMVGGKGQANVHNDILQFLAEHGAVGFGLLLAAVTVMLVPTLRGAWRTLRTASPVDWENPYVPPLLRVPAAIYAILCGTAATVIHSLIDLPFRSPAILITWALALACAPAFLPRQTQPAVANETPVDGAT